MKKLVTLLFVFLSLTSTAQTFDWARALSGGTQSSTSYNLVMDDSGNVYNVGIYSGTVDFDPGAATHYMTAAGASDAFISKLDSAGNFAWARTIGSATSSTTPWVSITGVVIDHAGDILLSGSFEGAIDFDPGSGTSIGTAAGQVDAFVMKVSSAGNLIWVKQFGSTSNDAAPAIAVMTITT